MLRYLGGKARLAPKIIPWLPPHDIYLEPFGGGASVLAAKRPVKSEIWNDLDGDLVNLFQVLRSDRKAELVEGLRLTPYARAEHRLAYEASDDPVERARRLLVRSHFGHGNNGVYAEITNGFRIDGTSGSTRVVGEWSEFPEALEWWIRRFRNVLVENRPAAELIERYDAPNVLIYADPPYVPDSRSASTRFATGKCTYRHELSIEDHQALLTQLRASQAMVVVSGYPSELYDREFRGWRRLELAARAHRNSPRTEVLWINPAASAAHGLFAA